MKNKLLFVATLLACASLSRAVPVIDETSIRIGDTPASNIPTFAATDTPAVTATITDAAVAWVQLVTDAGTTRVYLENSGTQWTGTMPPTRSGDVVWQIYATDDESQVVTRQVFRYSVTDELPDARYPALDTWRGQLTGSTTQTLGSWNVRNIRMSRVGQVSLPGSASPSASSQSYIRSSAIAGGVSTIYFKARNMDTNTTAVLTFDVMRNAIAIVESFSIELPSSENTEFVQYAVPIHSSTTLDGSYIFRFRNATAYPNPDTASQSTIDITDIFIAPMIPDVVITKESLDYEPGYPSVLDPVTFRIHVANKYANAPAYNLTPKLIWRQEGGAWNTSVMTNVAGRTLQGDGEYAVTITNHVAGSFEYTYQVDFNGYSPTFEISSEASGAECANIDDFSIFIRDDGMVALDRSPEYHRNFIDNYDNGRNPAYQDYAYDEFGYDNDLSHLFDLYNLNLGYPLAKNDPTFEIPGYYEYNTLQADEGVRRFRSQFDSFGLAPHDADSDNPSHLEPSYTMQQVGDYTWQAILYLTNAVDSYFTVTSTYRYVEGAYGFDSRPWYWGEINQEETAINPPMSGTVTAYHDDSIPAGADDVRVQLNYDGFLMFRFCTTNGSYQVRRAAWQDFNAWQADEDFYSRSFGLYDTQTFQSNLDNRDLSVFGNSPFVDPDETGIEASGDFMLRAYWNGLMGYNAMVFDETKRANPTNYEDVTANKAYRLSTYPRNPGSLETTYMVGGAGRGTFGMRARVSTDDDRLAVYRGTGLTADSNTYRAVGRANITSASDGSPSFSVYGYYQDINNYWEGRLTQVRDLRVNANNNSDDSRYRFLVEIRHCQNGVNSVVSSNYTSYGHDLQTAGGYTLSLTLETSGNTVRPTLHVYQESALQDAAAPNSTLITLNPNKSYDSTATSGTIAYNLRDCAGEIIPYVFSTTEQVIKNGSSSAAYRSVTTSDPGTEWEFLTDSYYGHVNPWTYQDGVNMSPTPTMLIRSVPTAYYRIKVYRSGLETSENFLAPVPSGTDDWDTDWDAYHGHVYDQVFAVNSFAWKTVRFPMNFWDDTYVAIEALHENGEGATSSGLLAVDDLFCDEWRGITIYDEDFGDSRNETRSWIATYAVITQEGREGRQYELNRTRANPDQEQSITTPLLENGVGDLLFSYTVKTHPVRFSVDLVSGGGGSSTPLTTVDAPVSSESQSLYVPALTNMSGRLRITMLPIYDEETGEEILGTLLVDNLRATDYPNTGSSSWEAYNVLVSPFRNNPSIKFDGAASQFANYRSAVLNDGYDRDTLQGYSFDAAAPHIQTPSISTGVGEVSFWYRASPDNEGRPARLVLKVAQSASAPESEWRVLTAEDLNPDAETYLEQLADFEALQEITTDTWTYFSAEFYMRDYAVLRIYSVVEDDPHNRVMLDNILITEPVRSSIDVGAIIFDPDIPLSTGDIGCVVELVNPRMNPYDITVYLDYYVGTNVWGYENWSSAPTGRLTFTNMVDAVTGLEERYKFASVSRIPRLPVDTVVQYAAIVDYRGTFASPVCSETQEPSNNNYSFSNPEWYEPVDLNEDFGTSERPVSHFWVFSVGTNMVFFHEINTVRYRSGYPDEFENQWIELIGPEGADISNWTIDVVGADSSATLWPDLVEYTVKVDSGARFQPPNNALQDKGWGFWVLGCYNVEGANQELFPRSVIEQCEAGESFDYLDYPGALVLKRSMGAYVERLCWRGNGQGASMTAQLEDAGFDYIGQKNRNFATSWALYFEEDDSGNIVPAWASNDNNSVGGYNTADEEDWIWSIKGDVADVPIPNPPEIAQPAITAFRLVDNTTAEITFTVKTTNGIALTDSDYSWYVDISDDCAFDSFSYVEITGTSITAPEDGTEQTVTITVNLANYAASNNLFFRIHAYPANP